MDRKRVVIVVYGSILTTLFMQKNASQMLPKIGLGKHLGRRFFRGGRCNHLKINRLTLLNWLPGKKLAGSIWERLSD